MPRAIAQATIKGRQELLPLLQSRRRGLNTYQDQLVTHKFVAVAVETSGAVALRQGYFWERLDNMSGWPLVT